MSHGSRLILKARRAYIEAAGEEAGTAAGFRKFGHEYLEKWEAENPETAVLLRQEERSEALTKGWRAKPNKAGPGGLFAALAAGAGLFVGGAIHAGLV